MIGAPSDESPVGSMPQAADKKNDERITDDLRLRAPAAAKRNINVVPEPGGEGNMPSPPELSDWELLQHQKRIY